MNKLCVFVGTFVVGTIFWYLGELLGLDFFSSFLLSGLGSIIGVWVGWKVGQKLS